MKGNIMDRTIEAIFMDVGNTLRIVVKDQDFMAQAKRDLMTLLETTQSESDFFEGMETRWNAYRKQAKETLAEASEKELWSKWLLPDYPTETSASLSGELTRLWRDRSGRRFPRADVESTIPELHRRGYALGIIANTITEAEIPNWLEADGLAQYFQTVVLSSQMGLRKPNPEIFWEAARRVGADPSKCAYVGDNPTYDVLGARGAGFGLTILMMDPASLAKHPLMDENQPDHMIREFSELLDIFPPRN
jgi:HAD superfamily hydrolase (TIGR01509 family)